MIVWGKVIECLIDADINYLNGEFTTYPFRVKGKFLVFGNVFIIEKPVPMGVLVEEEEKETVNKEGKEESKETEKKVVLKPETKPMQICVPTDATFIAYYQGMVAIMSFYYRDRDIYANVSLTDPDTIKEFIIMSTYYRKYGVSIPNILDKIMYRRVPK